MQVAVVGDDCVMFLLPPGEHKIWVHASAEEPHCGLVPIGCVCNAISTTGLKYNMQATKMQFGGLISVCNKIDPASDGHVWVKTDSPVLWTCELPKPGSEAAQVNGMSGHTNGVEKNH
eukprot:TRINITY_DN32824_c0_g1_i4.p1 TRINITY_DN32824_c0_g1~~TRINITY_DN32824_c0_g1_i4.p1  ORF type:complete len:118 (+),score=18.01 TRINITY_DN32824_c0_g1_i4:70-423(+)